jgi:hypothetical protein
MKRLLLILTLCFVAQTSQAGVVTNVFPKVKSLISDSLDALRLMKLDSAKVADSAKNTRQVAHDTAEALRTQLGDPAAVVAAYIDTMPSLPNIKVGDLAVVGSFGRVQFQNKLDSTSLTIENIPTGANAPGVSSTFPINNGRNS